MMYQFPESVNISNFSVQHSLYDMYIASRHLTEMSINVTQIRTSLLIFAVQRQIPNVPNLGISGLSEGCLR